MKYRKKPVVIEAVQFTLGNEKEVSDFVKGISLSMGIGEDNIVCEINIPTLEGVMTAKPNDWIIKGVKGEFYPIKDEIFKETYERVD